MPDDTHPDDVTDDVDIKAPGSVFQQPDDIFNPAVDEETLPEDGDSPAAPADTAAELALAQPDHPEKDYASDRDAQEVYDEGEDNATDNLTEAATETPMPLEPIDDDDEVSEDNGPH